MSFSQAGGISPAARALFEYLFGDQHQSSDFIYEDELNGLTRDDVLTRLDLALSRDQSEKIYVQTRMREQGRELFAWLEKGAHVYVCGDATRMAKDVDDALREVVAEHGVRHPRVQLPHHLPDPASDRLAFEAIRTAPQPNQRSWTSGRTS